MLSSRLLVQSFVSVILCSTVAGAAETLQMQDMKSLADQKQWNEILLKADQVKPSDRTAEWNAIVAKAGQSVMGEIAANPSGLQKFEDLSKTVRESEKKYSGLRSDSGYLSAKAKALQGVVDFCIKNPDSYGCGHWVESLANGITTFPKGTAKNIALLLGEEGSVDTLRYWVLAAKDDAGVCSHGSLQRAVIRGLKNSANTVVLDEAKGTAKTCFASMEDAMMKELEHAEPGSDYAKNACPMLTASGSMNMVKRKKCK